VRASATADLSDVESIGSLRRKGGAGICGADGRLAWRDERDDDGASDRQDACRPHSRDGCATMLLCCRMLGDRFGSRIERVTRTCIRV
jgi:hypothetical protein